MTECFFTIYNNVKHIAPSYTPIQQWGDNNWTFYFLSRELAELALTHLRNNHENDYPHVSQIVPVIPISPNLLKEYRWENGQEVTYPYGKGPKHGITH